MATEPLNYGTSATNEEALRGHGQREARYGKGILDRRIGGDVSLAREQQRGQLYDTRRQMAPAAARGGLEGRQAQWSGSQQAGGVIGRAGMARTGEILQGRQMASDALSRQTDYELQMQQMENERLMAALAARAQDERSRALEEDANRRMKEAWIGAGMSMLGGGMAAGGSAYAGSGR